MSAFQKIFIASFIVLGFIGVLAFSFWQKNKDQAMAQDFLGETKIVCEEPIPVGLAIDQAVSFLNDVYQTYQGDTIKTARDQVNDLVAIINANGNGSVCDFNECKAQVATGGPKATLEVKAVPLLPGKVDYGYTVPTCNIKEGVGNPCPSLSAFLRKGPTNPVVLEDFQNILNSQADNIHLLFEGKDQDIPANLIKEGEVAGVTKTSKADLVYRYVDDVEKNWFTPNPQSNTCALSQLERTRISQGLMGEKYPLSCLSALAQGIYSPKPWSETCQTECADNQLSDECRACLARCEGESVYATLNCKMYSFGSKASDPQQCSQCKNEETSVCDANECNSGNWGADCIWGKQYLASAEDSCYQEIKEAGTNDKCSTMKGQSKKCCGDKCANGVNSECYECLCDGLTKEQCLDWVCGGSKSNWVCCHEEPIQNPQWYVYDQTFATINVMEITQNQDGTFTSNIVAKSSKFGEAYGTFYKLWGTYNASLSNISLAFVMANSYRESKLNSQLGDCNLVDEKDANGNYTTLKQVRRLKRDIVYENGFHSYNYQYLVNTVTPLGLSAFGVPLSCPALGMKGGAMGPAQFIPRTWNDWKNKVKGLTGKDANPWTPEDAYLAGALYLKALQDQWGSEIEAAEHYIGSGSAAVAGSKQTMCIKQIFEDQINNRCFEKIGKNEACQKNLDKYIQQQCY